MDFEAQYIAQLRKILSQGTKIPSRNGITIQVSNNTISADCSNGRLPILTTKKVNYKAAIIELVWFLQGHANVKFLHDHSVHIWDQWSDYMGDLGPIYGVQWRKQFDNIINQAISDPFSRRLLIDSWNIYDLPFMRLPPCHYAYQIINYPTDYAIHTDLVVNMRSNDVFIGLPFNLVNYSVLLHYICSLIGTLPRTLYINTAASHIYEGHIDAVITQVPRKPLAHNARLSGPFFGKDVMNLVPSDFAVTGYQSHPFIKAEVYE